MNTAKFRSKRAILSTTAAVAVLAVGGVVWSSTASAELQGTERDRVVEAALAAVGEGTAVDVESSDDLGEAYEVEVRKDDGTEVDVSLDKELNVVAQDPDDASDDDDSDDSDADDVALGADERASAEKAALDAVDGGTVTDVEASDDRGEAYEVEVRDADNAEWDVELDADFNVVHKTRDQ